MKTRILVALMAVAVAATTALVLYTEEQARQRDIIKRAQYHLERGIELYHRKDYIHAEFELREAIRTYPDEWRRHFYMATVMVQQKRYPFAIPYLERALELNPWEPKILTALGVVYFKVGRLDMAKGYFTASLEIDPSNNQAKDLMEAMAKLQWRSVQGAAPEN